MKNLLFILILICGCASKQPCLTYEQCLSQSALELQHQQNVTNSLNQMNNAFQPTRHNFDWQQPLIQPMRNCWQDVAGWHCM